MLLTNSIYFMIRQHDSCTDCHLIVFVLFAICTICDFRNKFQIFLLFVSSFFSFHLAFPRSYALIQTCAHSRNILLLTLSIISFNILCQCTTSYFLPLCNSMYIGEDLPTMFSLLLNPAATEKGKRII